MSLDDPVSTGRQAGLNRRDALVDVCDGRPFHRTDMYGRRLTVARSPAGNDTRRTSTTTATAPFPGAQGGSKRTKSKKRDGSQAHSGRRGGDDYGGRGEDGPQLGVRPLDAEDTVYDVRPRKRRRARKLAEQQQPITVKTPCCVTAADDSTVADDEVRRTVTVAVVVVVAVRVFGQRRTRIRVPAADSE